ATQIAAFPSPVVVIPESASAVVPAYNIPGITNGVKFTGAILANIFLGKITMWNDPAIVAINPTLTMPAQTINVVHRSDASGTMFAFTNYLSDSSSAWKSGPGTASLPNWPLGLGCKGNEGVAGCIQNTAYSLGPLEIAYEIVNSGLISYGSVANAAGNYVLANLTNIAAAVTAGATGLPAGNAPASSWTPVSIINNIYNDTTDTTVYPITTFTYLVAYQAQASQAQGLALVNFLHWVVNSAQSAGTKLGYVPLPSNVVSLDNTAIKTITYNGTPLYQGP
ncbi:MAG: phosphate ABC transporter substrate-binding protein PstS, partial [Thaumarchaeota archaeon]|nr:phosphate ABC transporter substrate-binding protein PstS [Nitrososphaerota archaeon]